MIRLASTDDTLTIVNLLKQFLTETSYSQAVEASQDFEHLCKVTWITLQHGYIWLAYVDELPVGLLMAVKEPNLWLPKAKELKELVWYIRPEHRKNSIGGKLFLNFCKKGEELLKSGEIQGYFTTKMTTTDTIDYESRGFRQTEVTYIKE
jgi:hypothetical protein